MSDTERLLQIINQLEKRIAYLESSGPLMGVHSLLSADTNAVKDVLRLATRTTGTAADGIGTALIFVLPDASGNIDEAANIDAVLTTAAHATEAGELRLGVLGTKALTLTSALDAYVVNDVRVGGGLYVGTVAYDPAASSVTVLKSTDTADASGDLLMLRTRVGAIVQSGDRIGDIAFQGFDGATYNNTVAMIRAYVDGTPGVTDMPGRLVFYTCADGSQWATERMRIDSAGIVKLAARLQTETSLSVKDGISAPAAVAGYAQLYVDTADGDLKVIFGDGTVKVLSADT